MAVLPASLACGLTLMALCSCVSADKNGIADVPAVEAAAASPQMAANPAKHGQNYTDPMVVASAANVGQPPAVVAAYTETPAEPTAADNGNIALQPAAINAGQTSIFAVRQPVEAPEAAPVHGADGSIVPADLPAHGIRTTSTSLFSQPVSATDGGVAASPRPQPTLPPTRPKLKIGASAQPMIEAVPQDAVHDAAAVTPAETVQPDAAAVALASAPAPQKKNFSIRKFLGMAKD